MKFAEEQRGSLYRSRKIIADSKHDTKNVQRKSAKHQYSENEYSLGPLSTFNRAKSEKKYFVDEVSPTKYKESNRYSSSKIRSGFEPIRPQNTKEQRQKKCTSQASKKQTSASQKNKLYDQLETQTILKRDYTCKGHKQEEYTMTRNKIQKEKSSFQPLLFNQKIKLEANSIISTTCMNKGILILGICSKSYDLLDGSEEENEEQSITSVAGNIVLAVSINADKDDKFEMLINGKLKIVRWQVNGQVIKEKRVEENHLTETLYPYIVLFHQQTSICLEKFYKK